MTGQPGVDYPALTSIPATSFSCRGLRGGYYADLETNCQVGDIDITYLVRFEQKSLRLTLNDCQLRIIDIQTFVMSEKKI